MAGRADYAYARVPRSQSAPYWAMARQYVLADRMFPMEFGPSFTSHLSLIAANTLISPGAARRSRRSEPHSRGAATPRRTRDRLRSTDKRVERFNGPFPCFDNFPTIADTLDAAHVSWKYYAPPLEHIGGQGMVGVQLDSQRALRTGLGERHLAANADSSRRRRAARSPTFRGSCPIGRTPITPAAATTAGPSWVASIVNAIGQSAYWKSTAVVVVWDDWGGWYDNVPPPQLDFRGLGIRVPCIIISPYAKIAAGKKAGYVSHTQYEFGSVLKFVEQVFGLPPIGPPSLGFTDTRAASLMDSFDFTQTPRAFVPIPAKLSGVAFSERTAVV